MFGPSEGKMSGDEKLAIVTAITAVIVLILVVLGSIGCVVGLRDRGRVAVRFSQGIEFDSESAETKASSEAKLSLPPIEDYLKNSQKLEAEAAAADAGTTEEKP